MGRSRRRWLRHYGRSICEGSGQEDNGASESACEYSHPQYGPAMAEGRHTQRISDPRHSPQGGELYSIEDAGPPGGMTEGGSFIGRLGLVGASCQGSWLLDLTVVVH